MADVKWIRLNTDMFDNAKIKYLRKLPEGNNIVLFWVMLLAKAGKCNSNGYIFLTESIPYSPEMLAAEFDFELNTVNLALMSLSNLNMIQLEEHTLLIPTFDEHQNSEGLDKIREQTKKRVARYREKQKQLMESQICQYCGATAIGYDHILATARGGEDVDLNKVPCCIECNRIKNDKPIQDFLNANRDRINDDLVLKNVKLSNFVTLSNVTNRYQVTLRNAIEEDKERELELEKEIDIDIDITKVIEKWNSLNLNKLVSIKNNRLKALKARIKEFSKEDIFKAIGNIKESSFLQGKNDRSWTITFDWLLKPNNFIKVLEGNYKDKELNNGFNKNSSGFKGEKSITPGTEGIDWNKF